MKKELNRKEKILNSYSSKIANLIVTETNINSSNNDCISEPNSFFNTADESLITLFLMYIRFPDLNEPLSEIIKPLTYLINSISSIDDLDSLFMKSDDNLKKLYMSSEYYASYLSYIDNENLEVPVNHLFESHHFFGVLNSIKARLTKLSQPIVMKRLNDSIWLLEFEEYLSTDKSLINHVTKSELEDILRMYESKSNYLNLSGNLAYFMVNRRLFELSEISPQKKTLNYSNIITHMFLFILIAIIFWLIFVRLKINIDEVYRETPTIENFFD
ncbi:MAG: hypothetical protein N4A40_12605 [Tissierellales bacterium]|jgi:large-conductance mechanosensitive channel|nr:hypothetical protein [Tissierellales bacterium]